MESENEKHPWQAAEIQLIYKSNVKPSRRPEIQKSKDAYDILARHWDEAKLELVEQFKIMLINRANRLLGIFEVSSGGISGTVADPKLIFAAAIKAAACGIILAHNHPSGNLQPSQADIDLTRRLREGGKLLEINVLDHLILTSEKYYSFALKGSCESPSKQGKTCLLRFYNLLKKFCLGGL